MLLYSPVKEYVSYGLKKPRWHSDRSMFTFHLSLNNKQAELMLSNELYPLVRDMVGIGHSDDVIMSYGERTTAHSNVWFRYNLLSNS